MNATGEGITIAKHARQVIDAITRELSADEMQLKKLYEMRLASEKDRALWDKAKLGRDRMVEIQRRLGQIERQALALNAAQVTLTAEECALFAYAETT